MSVDLWGTDASHLVLSGQLAMHQLTEESGESPTDPSRAG